MRRPRSDSVDGEGEDSRLPSPRAAGEQVGGMGAL